MTRLTGVFSFVSVVQLHTDKKQIRLVDLFMLMLDFVMLQKRSLLEHWNLLLHWE